MASEGKAVLMIEAAEDRMLEAVCYFRHTFDGDEYAPRTVPLWTMADDLNLSEQRASLAAFRLASMGLIELTLPDGVGRAIGPMVRATDEAMRRYDASHPQQGGGE